MVDTAWRVELLNYLNEVQSNKTLQDHGLLDCTAENFGKEGSIHKDCYFVENTCHEHDQHDVDPSEVFNDPHYCVLVDRPGYWRRPEHKDTGEQWDSLANLAHLNVFQSKAGYKVDHNTGWELLRLIRDFVKRHLCSRDHSEDRTEVICCPEHQEIDDLPPEIDNFISNLLDPKDLEQN